MSHAKVFPSWHQGSRVPWTAPPGRDDIKNRLHPVRTTGLNVGFADSPLPRMQQRNDLCEVCGCVCLLCRSIDCEAHKEGSGLSLTSDASSLKLDVTDAALHHAMTQRQADEKESLYDTVKFSLVEDLELHVSPARLDTEIHVVALPPPRPCHFCAADAAGDHRDCPPPPEAEARDYGHALGFRNPQEAQRWLAFNGAVTEVVTKHVTSMPVWEAEICRCCGQHHPNASAFSPLVVEDQGRLLIFPDRMHEGRWRRCHPGLNPEEATVHPKGISVVLAEPPAWLGGCRCCGRAKPEGEVCDIAYTIVHPPGDATLFFDSSAQVDSWFALHPDMDELAGRVCKRRWEFGPAQLLPLLKRMRDFHTFRSLTVSLFQPHHVVRSIEGCGAREAGRVVHLGTQIWKRFWAQSDIRIIPVPRMYHNSARIHLTLGEPGALTGAIDGYGRRQIESIVKKDEVLARYDVGDQIDSLKVPFPGQYKVLKWEANPPSHMVDVVYLQEVVEPTRLATKSKERLAVQKDLARLRLEAAEGSGRDPKSASELAASLLSGRGDCRGAHTLRAQAETSAHVFHKGPAKPRVVVSTADALFMRVLRRYRASREDLLAILNGPRRHPGCLQVRWQRTDQSGAKQSGVVSIPPGGYTPNEGWRELHATSRNAKLQEWYQYLANETRGEAPDADLEIVEQIRQLVRSSPRLTRLFKRALESEEVLDRELKIGRVHQWCRELGVTHLVAHPVNEDTYYCGRNPYDNSGSAQCVTVKVVEGTERGVGFSALLLDRLGMDHDGDHANLFAVLDVLSAEIQEKHFGPEHRQFMETGKFVGGPTPWALERWCSLLEGDNLDMLRETALAILAGAHESCSIEPPPEVRASTAHAKGTPLVVVSAPPADQAPSTQPPLAVGTACVAAEGSPSDPETLQAVRMGDSGPRILCLRSTLWRSKISGGDILAAMLGSVLPSDYVIRLESCGREIWRGGLPVWGGALFSLQVPRRAAKGWERLASRVLDQVYAGAMSLGHLTFADELAQSGLDLRGRRLLEAAGARLRSSSHAPKDGADLTIQVLARLPELRHTKLLASFEKATTTMPWHSLSTQLLQGTFCMPGSRCLALNQRGTVRLVSLAQALARRRWFPDSKLRDEARWNGAIPLAQAALQLPEALAICLVNWLPHYRARSPHYDALAAEECGLLPVTSATEDAPVVIEAEPDNTPQTKRAKVSCTQNIPGWKLVKSPRAAQANWIRFVLGQRWKLVKYPRAARGNWARFFIIIRAARNMPSLDRPTLIDMLTSVHRDLGPLSALSLATMFQHTGYRIGTTSTLLARSDYLPEGLQGVLETCVDGFNDLWANQPPLPFPRPAGCTMELKLRVLAEALRGLFSLAVRGLAPTPPCGRCQDCMESQKDAATVKATATGRKMLAAARNGEDVRKVYRKHTGISGDDELLEFLDVTPNPSEAVVRRLVHFQARRALATTLLEAAKEDEAATLFPCSAPPAEAVCPMLPAQSRRLASRDNSVEQARNLETRVRALAARKKRMRHVAETPT